jgi:hypothetical protein
MRSQYTPEEFDKLMETWDPAMRAIAQERLATNYSRDWLEHFDEAEAATMRALLKQLIPDDEGIDLVGFIDWAAGRPLGRGDKRPGMPDEVELFKLGLKGLDHTAQEQHGHSFRALDSSQQEALISSMANGSLSGGVWQEIPPDYFLERYYAKALHGYFAHPRVWMRIGFMGASYPEGYTWLSAAQVKMRHERHAGWDKL